MSEPERVVGYARQSVTNNRDSLCAQADLITQWCSEHGHEPRRRRERDDLGRD
jgi:predicted site-specific integrase-resolvase